MLKQRALLTSLCAAVCAAPLLILAWPPALVAGPRNLADWQNGLDFGLAVLALLAWRLNQNRLVVVAAGLALATFCMLRGAAAGEPTLALTNAWLIAVPTGLGLGMVPKDGALGGGRTFAGFVLMLMPAVLAWSVATANPSDTAHWLAWHPWGGPAPAQPSVLALGGFLLFALAASRKMHARVAAVWLALGGSLAGQAVLAWGLVLAHAGSGVVAHLWLESGLAQAACLGLGLFTLYWQRVYLDELTGIPNRRALDERLAQLDGPYSLAMVDIDHFKKFNDTYGHAQGDDVLRMVAEHLKAGTSGRAFRYGGEEFCVLAPGVDSAALASLMDRTRSTLKKRRFSVRKTAPERRRTTGTAAAARTEGQKAQVTVSIGVARFDRDHASPDVVLKLADEGLYEAKAAGRDTVVKKN